MNAYSDLATKTFNWIFRDRPHSSTERMIEVQLLIKKNRDLLSNKSEKQLFIYELLELISRKKIFTDFRHQNKNNLITGHDFQFTTELHQWLIRLNSAKKEKNANLNLWMVDGSKLERLADYLVIKNLISPGSEDNFVNLFLNSDGETVKWRGTTTLLIYFFEQLSVNKLIDASISNKFLENNFTRNTGYISNIKQSKINISGKKPRQSDVIDEVIAEICDTLPLNN